jgi:hypothetical protein
MSNMASEILTLRTRLAEVEAERDQERKSRFVAYRLAGEAQARLAEVEAEREQRDDAIQRAVHLEQRIKEVRDWMGENNEDAEYDLVILALNQTLEGDRG